MQLIAFRIVRISFALALITSLSSPGQTSAEERTQLTTDQWLDDLDRVVELIETTHPAPFMRVAEERFYSTVESARDGILKAASNEESAAWIMRVVAVLDDTHTFYILDDLESFQRWFPVSLYQFSDGLFITAISPDDAQYIGAEVVRVGNMDARDALDRVLSVMPADNMYRRLHYSVAMFSNGPLLYGLGTLDSPETMSLELRLQDGRERKLTLHSSAGKSSTLFFNGVYWRAQDDSAVKHAFSDEKGDLPLHLRHLAMDSKNYWFTHLKNHRALYMQFSEVMNQEEESFAAFRERLWDYADTHADSLEAFILDLRYNGGGNGNMNLPFVHEIIKRDYINRRGHFYTLIGRTTTSAGLILMSLLNLHTNTIFVGEPAGGSEFLYSNARSCGPLPNSGMGLYVATTYFNLGWPASTKHAFQPDYPAPFSSADFFSGRDPALESILAGRAKPIEIILREEGVDGVLDYVQRVTYPWPFHSDEMGPAVSESSLNSLGYDLVGDGRSDEAIKLFELNTRLFPQSGNTWDSLAEAYMNNGDHEKAILYFKKSLKIDPSNDNAVRMLERLKAEK
jgi:tetratricopeptide (TPR) repeat protein